MSVTIISQERVGVMEVLVKWSSTLGTPIFRVFQDGLLSFSTVLFEHTFTVPIGESLLVEVLDDPTASPSRVFQGRLTPGWETITDAVAYLVEELVASVWTKRGEILERGDSFYRWATRRLEDVTLHHFRVSAIAANGRVGATRPFSVLMVRNPDVPVAVYTYDQGTGKATVTVG